MSNKGIIITIAYPETVVRVSTEWTVSHVYVLGVGKKNYLRAGHAALVLIDTASGSFDYYDFGRYITPLSKGRVRSKLTDHELDFSIGVAIENGKISNLNQILTFLATHPKLTHGDGKMLASVCDQIDYNKAKNYVESLQSEGFVKYSAFGKSGSNCSRFVTETLIESTTNESIKRKLIKSKWFTPSTIGNVLIASTDKKVYEVSETGSINKFKSNKFIENKRLFLDRLNNHESTSIGNVTAKLNSVHDENAQWLGGIGSGAWFELHQLSNDSEYRCKRISSNGTVDVDGIFRISETSFHSGKEYKFLHLSNCNCMIVEQLGKVYRLEFVKKTEVINLKQKKHLV